MTNDTIKVIRVSEIGDASVLQVVDEPRPKVGTNEVRIKVKALGLNRAEIMFRSGNYIEQPELPAKIGYEASGIVAELGEGVEGFQIGDVVSTIPAFSMNQYGVYGEEATVPASALTHYPENMSFQQGTALWMQYLTAYGAFVEVSNLQADQTVLITAASSSVGIAAIQLAKYLGAKVIATTRGPGKIDQLVGLGADHVIQTDNEDWVEKAREYTDGKGANLIFDPIAGPILNELAGAAAVGGRIIEYGALDPAPTPFPLYPVLAKNLIVEGYTLFRITTQPEVLARGLAFINAALASGGLSPVIDKEFVLEDIQEAHRYMESNQQLGKIIVNV